jgi:hypothetical protein
MRSFCCCRRSLPWLAFGYYAACREKTAPRAGHLLCSQWRRCSPPSRITSASSSRWQRFSLAFFWLTAGTERLSSFPVAGLSHYSCHGWFTILGSSPASKRPGSASFRSRLQLTGSNTWRSAERPRCSSFIGVAMALLATGGWRSGVALNSTIGACTLLCLLTLAAGGVISVHTPILTSRNMIVVLPAIYVIAAELTSCLMRRWGTMVGTTYQVLQIGLMCQALAAYYTIDVNEQWRDSATLVLGTPGCASGDIHVYGDASNYRFFTRSVRPNLQLIEIPRGSGSGPRQ